MTGPSDDEIAQVLMTLAHARGFEKTFCPSEAARRLSKDWRPLMPRIRKIAEGLPLKFTQKGVVVDPRAARGAARLSLR
ncbi:MAG: DUF3253 domain-containing protein [Pseudomonadota bacterium]